MKNIISFILSLMLCSSLFGQELLNVRDASTGLLLKTTSRTQEYFCGYRDNNVCLQNLDWLQRYMQISGLEADTHVDVPTPSSLFASVVSQVKTTNTAQLILIDYNVNMIDPDAFRNRLLRRLPNGDIVKTSQATGLIENRLTYSGIQLPTLKNFSGVMRLEFGNTGLRTNYSSSNYYIELQVDDAARTTYQVYWGQSVVINYQLLLGANITMSIYHDNELINEHCFTFNNDPYNPRSLKLPPYSHCHILESDNDGIADEFDNCPHVSNPSQTDTDGDGIGDACDDDIDGDGILNWADNCVYNFNTDQVDEDGDGAGDVCDDDVDGDMIPNDEDNCPESHNFNQADTDGDGQGDACDEDIDGDGILNDDDNCPSVLNADQADLDGDGIGDVCDNDIDGDGILNHEDNCPETANAGQEDIDGDDIGDVCDDELVPDWDSECQIQPTLSGTFEATQEFVVRWTGDPNNGDADILVEDFTDFSSYSSNGHPGINDDMSGVIFYDIYINPIRSTVKYPVLLSDGIDFFSDRTTSEIYQSFRGNEMLRELWENGFDLIVVDYEGGADFIQRNGYAFQEFMKFIKDEYAIDEIPAVIGPSMGGQIIRFALLDWEQNKVDDWGEHGVQLFLSADSPWEGANASPAMQAGAWQAMDAAANNQFFKINLMSNAPAARQLLLNHVNHDNFAPAPNGMLYDPSSHPFRDQFTSDLAALGSVPQNVERMISIADGSANGESTGNVAPGEKFLKLVFPQAIVTDPSVEFAAIDIGRKIVDANSFLGALLGKYPFISTWSLATGDHLDSAPGSPFALQSLVPPGESESADGTKVRVEYPDEEGRTFGFIPTFSALGVNTNDPFLDISEDATPSSTGFEHDLTPFDRIFFDNVDSEHNGLRFNNALGLTDQSFFIDNLLEVAQPPEGYDDCDYLADFLSEGTGFISPSRFSITECYQTGIGTSCLLKEFPNNTTTTITQTSGPAGVDLIRVGNHFSVNYDGPVPVTGEATFSVCMQVNLGNCSEEICKNVTVYLDLRDCDIKSGAPNSEPELIDNGLDFYPNPTTGMIRLNNNIPGILKVISLDGKVLETVEIVKTGQKVEINQATGLYILSFTDENGNVSNKKLVITK